MSMPMLPMVEQVIAEAILLTVAPFNSEPYKRQWVFGRMK